VDFSGWNRASIWTKYISCALL